MVMDGDVMVNNTMQRKHGIIIISYSNLEYDGRLKSFLEVLNKLGKLYCFTNGFKPVNKNSKVCHARSYARFINEAISFAKKIIMYHDIDIVFLDNRKATIPGLILNRIFPNLVYILDCRELYIPNEIKRVSGKLGCYFERVMINNSNIVICANKERSVYMKKEYGINAPIVYENIRRLKYDKEYVKERTEKKFRKYLMYDEIRIIATSGCSISRMTDVLVKNVGRVNRKCRLLLVGDSKPIDRKIIKKIIHEMHISNVNIVGTLNQSELKYLLSHCHIGIVNYNQKDINNKYCASGKAYEFLHEGLPIVTTTNPPLCSLCEKFGVGCADDLFFMGINKVIANYGTYRKKVEEYIKKDFIMKSQEKMLDELSKRL